jgi:ubiquinone/menaquinone biosynthesis C-methylase UbiE
MANDVSARSYGRVFDAIAAEYDRSRPTYPDELVDAACELAGIADGDEVLEVGCGSGQLTRSLVARGLHVTAVDPGRHLISLAERNVGGPGRAEFVNARFEDAPLPHSRYRAVFSASAFHWIDPDVSWRNAAQVLAPGGTLTLIQHFALREEDTIGDHEALLAAFTKVAPEITADWPSPRDMATINAGVEERRDNVSEVWEWLARQNVARSYARDLFSDVQIAAVPIRIEQTADELNAFFRTTSIYHRLSPDQRRALEIEDAGVYERLGRPIRSSLVVVAVTARRS